MKDKYQSLCKKSVDIRDFSRFKPSDVENITILNTLINQYISRLWEDITTTISAVINEPQTSNNLEIDCSKSQGDQNDNSFSIKDSGSTETQNIQDFSQSNPINAGIRDFSNMSIISDSSLLESDQINQSAKRKNRRIQKQVSFNDTKNEVRILFQ